MQKEALKKFVVSMRENPEIEKQEEEEEEEKLVEEEEEEDKFVEEEEEEGFKSYNTFKTTYIRLFKIRQVIMFSAVAVFLIIRILYSAIWSLPLSTLQTLN